MTETSPSDFYLYLPSNTSIDTYPDNGPTGFTINLPNTLELNGEWEVALAGIVYPHSWVNIGPRMTRLRFNPIMWEKLWLYLVWSADLITTG